MSKINANTRKQNKRRAKVAQTESAKLAPIPTTLAGCYGHAWTTLFNKLPKKEQETLTHNLQIREVVRGKEVTTPDVDKFIKAVANLGEEFFALRQKQDKHSKTSKA